MDREDEVSRQRRRRLLLVFWIILGTADTILFFLWVYRGNYILAITVVVGTLAVVLNLRGLQRSRRFSSSKRLKPWEIALVAGVLVLLATWNLLIVGFDTSLPTDFGLSILMGIAVALLVYGWRAHR